MIDLTELRDVGALGGTEVDLEGEDSPDRERAERLITLASALVLSLLEDWDVTEDDIAAWPESRVTALKALVGEIASKRLNVSAAPSVDPYATPTGPQTIKLTPTERRAIVSLIPISDDHEGDDRWKP